MKRVIKLSPDGGWVWVMGDSTTDGTSSGSHEDGWLRLPWATRPAPDPSGRLNVDTVVDNYLSLGDSRSRFEKDLLFHYGPSSITLSPSRKSAVVKSELGFRLINDTTVSTDSTEFHGQEVAWSQDGRNFAVADKSNVVVYDSSGEEVLRVALRTTTKPQQMTWTDCIEVVYTSADRIRIDPITGRVEISNVLLDGARRVGLIK